MTIAPLISYIVTAVLGAVAGWLALRVKSYKRREKTIDQIAIMTCRQVIYSEHFDIDEKIEAYLLYKSKNANHRTKAYMSELVGKDIDEYLIDHKQAE